MIPSVRLKRFTRQHKNWETAQKIICHCDLLRKTACLKKAMSKRILF